MVWTIHLTLSLYHSNEWGNFHLRDHYLSRLGQRSPPMAFCTPAQETSESSKKLSLANNKFYFTCFLSPISPEAYPVPTCMQITLIIPQPTSFNPSDWSHALFGIQWWMGRNFLRLNTIEYNVFGLHIPIVFSLSASSLLVLQGHQLFVHSMYIFN